MDIFNKEKIADLEAELVIYKARCQYLELKCETLEGERDMYKGQRDSIGRDNSFGSARGIFGGGFE